MELIHALNRGVDKRDIFLDGRDYARFMHDLYEFNDSNPAINMKYVRRNTESDVGRPKIAREKIVEIHGWCLMKNHYHLLLSELVDGGVSLFLRKLNVGYANYFNERRGREGTLFQGRTKKIPIERDAHFLYILHYIHLNPLDFLREAKDWRGGTVGNIQRALAYLEKYKWSSYRDYIGHKNFPSILTTSLFGDIFSNYKKELAGFLREEKGSPLLAYDLE